MKKILIVTSILIIALVCVFLLNTKKDTLTKSDIIEKPSPTKTHSKPETPPQTRDWEQIKRELQADLERPQDEIPWHKIGPIIMGFLEEDEPRALTLLTELTGNINHYALRLHLEDYYIQNNKTYKGLEALKILQNNPTLNTPLVERLLEAHAKIDFESAHNWLLKNPGISGTESAAAAVGFIAGQSENPATIFEEIHSSTTPENIRPPYLQGLMKSWVSNDLEGSLLHLSNVELGADLDQAVYGLIGDLSKIDPKNTMLWAEMITSSSLRQSAILETAKTWSQDQPTTYFEWKKQIALAEEIMIELP